MGSFASRQNAAVEEADVGLNHAYKYPPRTGTYFGSHFIMGGERFDTPQPESYLFGENCDLNFLGNRPTAFPYPPPQANEPTKTLKSLINIRKESVRFVKAPESAIKITNDESSANNGSSFNIEFIFDADAKCTIKIYYFCTEEVTPSGLTYVPRDAKMTSDVFHCKRGVNQLFLQTSHVFNPALYPDDLSYNPDRDIYPIAIHCVVDEGPEENRQSHTTICVVDHHSDGTYGLRALKQKIFVDGLCYLLQEIYGIENKSINKTNIDDENDDNSSECVICMSDTRDTLILPCRHLCLCNSCADSLRYQANNCPICRAPFRALLQIRAVQKNTQQTNMASPQQQALQETNGENIPPGYIAISLIEALNGPPLNSTSMKSQLDIVAADTNETDSIKAAAEALNRTQDNNDKTRDKKDKSIPPEIRMSVLLTKEDLNFPKSTGNIRDKSPRQKNQSKQQSRDSMHLVNEKNAANLQAGDHDDDSENENLSPLLHQKSKKSQSKHGKKASTNGTTTPGSIQLQFQHQQQLQSALHIDGVDESIDDTDTDLEERGDHEKTNRSSAPNANQRNAGNADGDTITIGTADDSDYYTPEDPQTTILSPLCPDKNKSTEKARSKESLSSAVPSPLVAIKETASTSLPDSPFSASSTSTRSSADSYSSSSSTRKLLSTSSAPIHEMSTAMATNSIPSIAASRIIDIKVCDDKQISIDKAVDV